MKIRRKHTFTPDKHDPDVGYWVWYVENAHAGCHLWVNEYKTSGGDVNRSGGIELHRKSPPPHSPHDAPDHSPCVHTGVPCWHDGSSLAAERAVQMKADGHLGHRTAFGMAEDFLIANMTEGPTND